MLQGSPRREVRRRTRSSSEYSLPIRGAASSSWLDSHLFVGSRASLRAVKVSCNWALTDGQMLDWGWRVPFLIAGPLGLIGLYMRLKLEESPAFQQQLDEHEKSLAQESAGSEFKTIVKDHWRPLLVRMGFFWCFCCIRTSYLTTYWCYGLRCSYGYRIDR
ncbi:hypothetical protein [Streptomyces sp. DHE17-7]|uniref:hypothetical protein n=1 Tax=Streptomyces sp. DHE17-7 TaxID=2759949 RepID=UPI003FA75D70